MIQINLNKFSGYMGLAIKDQNPKGAGWRHALGSQGPASRSRHAAAGGQNSVSRIQHPASNIRRLSAGFTLLEVLIAMSVMAIVLVSVYRMHSQTLTMTTANKFYTQAPMLAQSKLAQLEAKPKEIINGESGDFGEKFTGYQWSVSTEGVSSETLGEAAEDLKRIDLTISLNENEYVYSLRTYRFFRE